MKVALTLRDFLDTYFDNASRFIIVSTPPDHNYITPAYHANYITPAYHAWSNSSKECQDKWNELENDNKITKKVRALSFTNEDFDVGKLYGEYADWFVESFETTCFINPFTNELDNDCIEITIYKEPDEEAIQLINTNKVKENKNDL